MAVNYEEVSERIFNLLVGSNYDVNLYNAEGKLEINPKECVRFAIAEPEILIRVDQTDETLRLSTGMSVDDSVLRKQLKEISDDFLLNFDYRRFNKKLSAKSEQIDIAQKSEKDMADVMEGFGPMTGSSKTSYQPLDNVKLVVRHKTPVDETSRGARSRNIHSVFVQRGEEKFKMAENNLKAARAMARHLQMGGEVFDNVGTAITELSEEHRNLKEFVGYVRRSNLVNEGNSEYVTLAIENINQIKNTLDKLCGPKTYANAVESLLDRQNVEVLEDDIDLEAKFTETHFDNKVANAIDSIKKGLYRQQSYRNSIQNAIATETFTNLKNMLNETELDFATPHAKLSYQVSQLGNAAQSSLLRNHLHGISKKLSTGATLDHYDYNTVKSCLLSANQPRLKAELGESVVDKYEQFIESFDIL